jgi:hypothetical protein
MSMMIRIDMVRQTAMAMVMREMIMRMMGMSTIIIREEYRALVVVALKVLLCDLLGRVVVAWSPFISGQHEIQLNQTR